MTPWLDISVALRNGMPHWPEDPPVEIQRLLSLETGGECNLTSLSMSAHTGTHMDAPLHYLPQGPSLDQMPLEATIGPARVIAIEDPEAIQPEALEPHQLRRGERLLFKTRNSARAWWHEPFNPQFVHLTPAAARFLAERNVRTVGIDCLSVGAYARGGPETHRALLAAGIWIIEGLNLSEVTPGAYQLVCLPLKILGSDGAPARAVLRKI